MPAFKTQHVHQINDNALDADDDRIDTVSMISSSSVQALLELYAAA